MVALFKKGNFLVFFLTIIFWGCFIPAASSHSAALIAKEDFEDQNFSDFFHAAQPDYWNNLAITSYQPHSGVYSLRGNACSSCTDPITGRQGRNRTDLNFGYTPNPGIGTVFDLDSLHDNELYVRFWLKYDANFDPADGYSSNKVWWMQFEGDTDTYYVQFRGSSLSYYDEAGHTRETYSSISPDAVDGKWHLWEIYVRYNDYGQDNGILRVWFDSQEKVYYTNARFILSDGGKISRMCFGYFHNSAGSSAGWQIDDIEIWDGIPDSEGSGGESGANDTSPRIQITSPTSENSYVSDAQTVTISGSADDDNGINSIVWANNRGGSGNATNDSGDWTLWSVANIPLQEGENVITVTATDTGGQTATDTITVTYNDEGTVQVWSANDQTGDSDWDDSGATWCVRALIEGDSITQAGNQIMLGFQGRTSGDYRIRKVSIAEKDPNGEEGDVVDSTWTKVTFDGKDESTWDSDVVTMPSGSMKLSNPVSFNIQPGKDYYVTYLLESPSVYLIAPSYYQEMYFEGSDHTEDVDWSSNGHSTYEARLHAIAAIYVTSAGSNPDTTPPGDVTNASITRGPGKITLSWTNPTDSDFAGVMIRFRTDGAHPQSPSDGQPIPNGNNGRIPGNPGDSMSYEHNNLDPNLHYYYAIFTYDTSGNYSHTVFLDAQPLPTTDTTPPTPPTGVTVE